MTSGEGILQEKLAATRNLILNAALELLVERPDVPFSHEAIAKSAGVGARTVYRYFPAQADLYEALWLRVREQTGTVFPVEPGDIIPLLRRLYAAFDLNAKLVLATMSSPAGARVRARGAAEGRDAFDQSLKELMKGSRAAERRQVRAVLQGIYSAPFWEVLRGRGGLSGSDAAEAASWATETLLEALRRKQKRGNKFPNSNQVRRSK